MKMIKLQEKISKQQVACLFNLETPIKAELTMWDLRFGGLLYSYSPNIRKATLSGTLGVNTWQHGMTKHYEPVSVEKTNLDGGFPIWSIGNNNNGRVLVFLPDEDKGVIDYIPTAPKYTTWNPDEIVLLYYYDKGDQRAFSKSYEEVLGLVEKYKQLKKVVENGWLRNEGLPDFTYDTVQNGLEDFLKLADFLNFKTDGRKPYYQIAQDLIKMGIIKEGK